MFSVECIFRVQFSVSSSWKIDFCPRTKDAVISALTLLGSAIFCDLGAVLIVCYDLMRGWYDYLRRGNPPLILNAGLIDMFFVTFSSFICERVPIDSFWDTVGQIETFSIERYNSIRSMRICSRTIRSLERTYTFWKKLRVKKYSLILE